MIKKIISGFFLGLMLTIFCYLNDPWVLAIIEQQFLAGFEQALACKASGRLVEVRLTNPGFVFNDLQVGDRHGDGWRWSVSTFAISWNWWAALKRGALPLCIQLNDLQLHSTIDDNRFAIAPHVRALTQEPAFIIPLCMQQISAPNATFFCADASRQNRAMCHVDIALHLGNNPQVQVSVSNTECWLRGSQLLADLNGTVALINKRLQSNLLFQLPSLGEHGRDVSLAIGHEQQRAQATGATADQTLVIKECSCDFSHDPNVHLHIQTSAGLLSVIDKRLKNLSGSIEWDCMLSSLLDHPTIAGNLQGAGVAYNDHIIAKTITGTFNCDFQDVHAQLQIDQDPIHLSVECDGKIATQEVNAKITNTQELPLFSSLILKPEQAHCWVHVHDKKINAQYQTVITRNDSPFLETKGIISGPLDDMSIKGSCGDCTITGRATFGKQSFHLEGNCYTKDNESLLKVSTQPNGYSAEIGYALVHDLGALYGIESIPKKGALKINACLSESQINGSFSSGAITLRLPNIYNFVTEIQGNLCWNFALNRLECNDLVMHLHRGTISCKRGIMSFADGGKLKHFYLPLLMQGCLINSNKDLFAMISGFVVCSGSHESQAAIIGSLILDKTQLRENIFSSTVQKKLFGSLGSSVIAPLMPDHTLQVTVQTKDPILMRTPLVQAKAHLKAAVSGNAHTPLLAGSIKINTGTIFFPYKPLHIRKGMITFLPGRIADPLIEFVAKNKIKQYNVTLQLAGSLQNHHLMLDSSPPLTQEQIMCLLLAGSEDSFTGAVPAILMQNMKQLIFDTEHVPSKLQSAIAQLFSPLKHIYLIPSFSDQTSRGGLRGAIEIDIGERWRGLIQKNFSLSEDTRFEIEYALSDDMYVRAFRDERQDIGAEVEFRWKF